MSFVSPEFLFLFLPLVVIAYHLSYKIFENGGFWILLGASALFYGLYSWLYLSVLIGLSACNYLCAKYLISQRDRLWTGAMICLNLIWLGYIKYATFISGEFLRFGWSEAMIETSFVLAISFYTFQNIAFIVDVRRGEIKHLHFAQYMLFVMNFAQLISGPLVRYQTTTKQYMRLHAGKVPIQWQLALAYIAIGLCKKLLIADTLNTSVIPLFDVAQYDVISAWHSLYALGTYGLYIYFDFSGFCDIAIGLGLLFGIRLPKNFTSPYQARNIRAFWRAWHITLSQFFSRYVYQPLGGNRHGLLVTLALVLLVFGLSGIWHGANYTFMVWGLCHGVMLCMLIIYERLALPQLPKALAIGLTLTGCSLAWVFFKADSLDSAWHILSGFTQLSSLSVEQLIDLQRHTGMEVLTTGVMIIGLYLWVLTQRSSHTWARVLSRTQPTTRVMSFIQHPYVIGMAIFVLFKFIAFSPSPDFIYVQF